MWDFKETAVWGAIGTNEGKEKDRIIYKGIFYLFQNRPLHYCKSIIHGSFFYNPAQYCMVYALLFVVISCHIAIPTSVGAECHC